MSFREKAREVIFGVETRAGRAFDVVLIVSILVSVLVAMLETVPGVAGTHGASLRAVGWCFTGLFTVEYLVRLWCAEKPLRYAFSFFGVVDFLAVVPAYAALFTAFRHLVTVVRVLRLLRIFRVFGLATYVEETRALLTALKASARRIVVFLLFIMTMVAILGSLMYVVERGVEGGNRDFDSIPRGIYWAIVTLTTVGYGDIHPQTGLGQAIAAVIMIMGYSLIVVPTGFVSVAVAEAVRAEPPAAGGAAPGRTCPGCSSGGHDPAARFCSSCGARLSPEGAGDGG
ncbi:MAG: ion transporter [Planctomycetota bacterium]|jgi:voltage-gated potassium channel